MSIPQSVSLSFTLNDGVLLLACHFNRSTHWEGFVKRIQLLAANSSALRNSKVITAEALLQLTSDTRKILSRECKASSLQEFHEVMASGSLASSAGLCHGASRSALWLPLDLVLEDAMDGSQVNATSAVEIITGKNSKFYRCPRDLSYRKMVIFS